MIILLNPVSIQPKFQRNASSRRLLSALALLVPRISTDHANNAVATNDLAIAANFLYRCQHFHN